MKKQFIYFLSLVIGLTGFTGCTKWTDYNPREDFRITEMDYLQSESDKRPWP